MVFLMASTRLCLPMGKLAQVKLTLCLDLLGKKV